MPKLDPDDQGTVNTTAAPAPLPTPMPATQTSTSGFGSSTPSTGGFGSGTGFSTPPTNSFGASPTAGTSSFGSPSGFGSTSGGFGSSSGFSGSQGFNNFNNQASAQQSAATANAFGNVMAAEAESGAPPEHWMAKFWRPAMGWLYMLICFADFVAFPLLSMFLPLIERGFGVQVGYTAWTSLTLSNGGLIHLAFGAILGVSAYGTTKERTK